MGWGSLICFNLGGFAYLYWAKKIDTVPGYRSRWLAPIHTLVILASVALLIALWSGLISPERMKIDVLWMSYRHPPMSLVAAAVLSIVALGCVPLAGGRTPRRPRRSQNTSP